MTHQIAYLAWQVGAWAEGNELTLFVIVPAFLFISFVCLLAVASWAGKQVGTSGPETIADGYSPSEGRGLLR